MSFSRPVGTRGARQPGGPIARWSNKMMSGRIRRGDGTFMGMNALVLTTVGAKSGQRRTTPVAWFSGPDEGWAIVASAAGARSNPSWYYNLAAHPDRVAIDVGGEHIDVVARELHGDERDAAWRQITTASRRFAEYQVKTDRELPVILLTRR